MPVRIYDIAKKLGLENKDIISKAKSLGITAAKVASSSLDKISAEYLEGEILKDHPDIAARLHAPPVEAPKAPVTEEKIVVIRPAEAVAQAETSVATATATATVEAEPPPSVETKEDVVEPIAATAIAEPPPPPPAPVAPVKPAP